LINLVWHHWVGLNHFIASYNKPVCWIGIMGLSENRTTLIIIMIKSLSCKDVQNENWLYLWSENSACQKSIQVVQAWAF
jgi:hypothetical protein